MKKTQKHILMYLFLVVVVLFLGIQIFEEFQTLPLQIENAMTVAVFVLMISLLVLHIAHIRRTAEMAEEYEKIDDIKQEFIAMAGNEMKTPITNIRAYMELLRKEESELNKEQLQLAKKVEDASANLNDLVSDMIESTELDRGITKFEYSDFNIEEVISEVVESFIPIAEEKGLSLKKEGLKEMIVHSDRAKVRRALVNLVSNAIKYTPSGEVSISYDHDGNHVDVTVNDSGIGISEEDRKKLFQKFYRIKSEETQAIAGTGLGLWLTRAIMRKLGGNIEVQSKVGVGTKFVISIPITKPTEGK